ncbi:MAG: glycoside hydrolase family 5 protein [Pseudomonadota bacterium]
MNRRVLLMTVLAAACAKSSLVAAQTRQAGSLGGGVNISGLEFNPNRLPGRLDVDYVAPQPDEIAYYRAAGARVLRIPFLWERLQPNLDGPFEPNYTALLDSAIADARGLHVILEAHQFGRRQMNGANLVIGEHPALPARSFASLWGRLANKYQSNPSVVFGLQNEPHDQNTDVLVAVQNQAIAAIRAVDARRLILVSGNAWSGAHSWASSGNAAAMLGIRDPANNFAFDAHQYLDRDSSGVGDACVSGAGRRLASFTTWARAHGKRGFLGEFGGGANDVCDSELEILLGELNANADVWLGWTCWGGGAWWPENYPLRLAPISSPHPVDRPQMRVLRRYF